MTIRDQQMQLLADSLVKKFEAGMTEHLRRCFPDRCKELGEIGVQSAIRYGLERAKSYGIELEREVCKYIDLMFTFGRNYDHDPRLPWASAILKDDTLDNSSLKIERLFDAAKDHVPEKK